MKNLSSINLVLIELTACNAVEESVLVHCHRHPKGRRPIVHSSMKIRIHTCSPQRNMLLGLQDYVLLDRGKRNEERSKERRNGGTGVGKEGGWGSKQRLGNGATLTSPRRLRLRLPTTMAKLTTRNNFKDDPPWLENLLTNHSQNVQT
ncbi:hypothetical protein M0804_007836 [Polistes exclamans]|nr:hypothetical protein M0804_007836 [Polistes exclamans]